jgi:hypothetical protein
MAVGKEAQWKKGEESCWRKERLEILEVEVGRRESAKISRDKSEEVVYIH